MIKRRNKRRKIFGSVFVLGLVLYLLTLLWLLPIWIKTPVNEQLKQMDLQLDYQRLWINPFTLNVHMAEPKLKNLSGLPILSANKIDIDCQLLPLLNRQIILDHIQLNQADLVIEFNHNNQLIRPSLPQSSSDKGGWQFFPGQLEVSNSSVTIKRQDQNLPIQNVNLTLNLAELNNPEQTGLIRFETPPDGEVTIQKQNNGHTFQWQISHWPLQALNPWLRTDDNRLELAGQLSASGTLTWPDNQLPVVEVTEANLVTEQLRWSDFIIDKIRIKAQDIYVNANKKDIVIGHIESTGGQLNIEKDPLNLITHQTGTNTQNNGWTWQFNDVALSNWVISIKNNRPAVKVHITELTMNKKGEQQNAALTLKLQAPFKQPVQISAQGPLNPLQLTGQIKADKLALASLNPWLGEITNWQFQETLLTVNSPFCLTENNLHAIGEWTLPQMTLVNPNQFIEAQQTQLQTIGILFNQKSIALNNIKSAVIEIQSKENQATSRPTTSDSPQSPDQEPLWQVSINQNILNRCKIKPQSPL